MSSSLNQTAKALWEAVKNCGQAQPDKVPEGSFTIGQIAQMTGRSLNTVRTKMDAALDAGRVKRVMYRIRVGKEIRPVAHYSKK